MWGMMNPKCISQADNADNDHQRVGVSKQVMSDHAMEHSTASSLVCIALCAQVVGFSHTLFWGSTTMKRAETALFSYSILTTLGAMITRRL